MNHYATDNNYNNCVFVSNDDGNCIVFEMRTEMDKMQTLAWLTYFEGCADELEARVSEWYASGYDSSSLPLGWDFHDTPETSVYVYDRPYTYATDLLKYYDECDFDEMVLDIVNGLAHRMSESAVTEAMNGVYIIA